MRSVCDFFAGRRGGVALVVAPFLKDLMDLFLSSSTSFATLGSTLAEPFAAAPALLFGRLEFFFAPPPWPTALRPIATHTHNPARASRGHPSLSDGSRGWRVGQEAHQHNHIIYWDDADMVNKTGDRWQ